MPPTKAEAVPHAIDAGASNSIALTSQSGKAVSAAAIEAGERFWSRFRRAGISGDIDEMVSMTAPRLRVRGMMDFEPQWNASGSSRRRVLKKRLEQPESADDGTDLGSLREAIEKTRTLPTLSWLSPEYLQVHSLLFQRDRKGVWKLIQVYEQR